ncbi:MAG: hypothetical protein ACRD3J_06800, partial [Thermoanaerobaculia bacterium]
GLVIAQRRLTCWNGHRIKIGEDRPFEVTIPCGYQEQRGSQVRCEARLFLFMARPRILWAMDITAAETVTILRYSLDTDEIVHYFGVDFPVDLKITAGIPPV